MILKSKDANDDEGNLLTNQWKVDLRRVIHSLLFFF